MLEMLEIIRKNIERRMAHYTDSRHPSGDEVAIAWLVGEIDRLREGGDKNDGECS